MRVGILVPFDDSFAKNLARVSALGFTSGQVSIWDMSLYTDSHAERLAALCTEHSFEITALWCGWSGPVDWKYPGMYTTLGLVPAWLRAQRMNDLIQGAAFARKLGIRDVVTHIGYLPDNPLDENYLAIAHAVGVIAKTLLPHGQRLLFETGEELPVTLVQLIETVGTGNLGVNFDPANLLSSGRANPGDALDLLAPYLMGMHAKDATAPAGKNPKGKETPIGKGQVDFTRLMQIIKKVGYTGDITIERETAMDDIWAIEVTQARDYLHDRAKECAL